MSDTADRPLSANSDYGVFTTKFDREVTAESLSSAIGHMSAGTARAVEQSWKELETGLLSWRTAAHIRAAESAKAIRAHLSKQQREDTVIALLFDQSGSMKGQKMLFAAASADIVQEHLLSLKITCEILGFTTVRWRGGKSRTRWNLRFRPNNPGRLNDVLHIVYKDGDDRRASTGGQWPKQMLRPDMPKENIDGEAILWAANRLSQRPETNKILIVVSDGAPVDDSTLSANHGCYLEDHIRTVIGEIDAGSEIKVVGVGLGFEVGQYYPHSVHTEAPSELATLLLDLVEQMLV